MQIQRAKLLDALKLTLSGCGDDQVFDSAVFHDGWLSSYNETISVSAPVEDLKDLKAVVKVKDFQKLVQKLKGDTIDIELANTGTDGAPAYKVTLDCGNTHAELATFPDSLSGFLEALALDKIEWSELPKNFGSMLALCRLDNPKHNFPLVHVDGTDMLADEAIRANFGTLESPMPKFSLHTVVAKELLGMGSLVSYCIMGPWFHVFTAAGAVFSCQMHTAVYPAAKMLGLKKKVENLDVVFTTPVPVGFAEALDRVETFAVASQTGALGIQVQITADALTLKTSKEAGNVSEPLFWETALPEGIDIGFEASAPFLREAAKKLNEFSVVLFDTKPRVEGLPMEQWPIVKAPRLVFRGPDFMQLVMVLPK